MTIDHDLSCMICGYNLRGLQTGGACPECGTDIARSRQGDLLKFADRNWLNGAHRGTFLLSASTTTIMLSLMAMVAMQFVFLSLLKSPAWASVFAVVLGSVVFASVLLMIFGVWMITKQEPRVSLTEQAASSRRLATGALLAVLILFPVCTVVPQPFAHWVRLAAGISFVVGMANCLRYLETLARRIPDDRLVGQVRRRYKGLLGFGLLFCCLATIGAVVPISATALRLDSPWLILFYVASALSGLCFFFAAISSIAILSRFRPTLKKVLQDA